MNGSEYLKQILIEDRVLNPEDLPEFQKRLSQVLDDFLKAVNTSSNESNSSINLKNENMPKSIVLPENISPEEVLKLSKMKELYIKYTGQGLEDNEYETMRQLALELSYCFAVDTKI